MAISGVAVLKTAPRARRQCRPHLEAKAEAEEGMGTARQEQEGCGEWNCRFFKTI